MRVLMPWALVLLVLAGVPVLTMAAQGCDECQEIKKELREAGLDQPSADAPSSPPAPVVRVVMYWLKSCGHCHQVLEGILPQMQQKYGAQLEVRLIEIVSMEDIAAFYTVTEQYGFTRGSAGVPFLMIGDRALEGVEEITAELPKAIEVYLAEGGVDWPALQPTAPAPPTASTTKQQADASCGLAVACTETVADGSRTATPVDARREGAQIAGASKPLLVVGGMAGLVAVAFLALVAMRHLPMHRP